MDGTREWARGLARAARAVLLCLVVAGTVASGTGAVAQAATRPNIVLILTDDQRRDTLSVMPNVRALLAGHGVTFSQAFVNNPWCCPSRSTYLTGLTSGHTDVWQLWPPHGGFQTFTQLGKDRSTIATWLHGAGYRTGMFGKYLNGYGGSWGGRPYVPPGWDRWFAFTQESPRGAGYYYDYGVMDQQAARRMGHDPFHYSTDVLGRKAVDFIRNSKGPFFAYLAPYAPHIPAIPAPGDSCSSISSRPPSFNEPNVRDKPRWVRNLRRFGPEKIRHIDHTHACQLAALKDVDRWVGRIVALLKARGELHNTMFVFTSDNGYLWGEHRWGEKRVPYEEAIRVPLIMRYDPITSQSRTSTRLVSNIDLAPTLAALAGVRPTTAVDGVSLMPLLRGPVSRWRTAVLIEHGQAKKHPDPVTSYCAVRTVPTATLPHAYMFIVYRTGERELYKVDTDPYELTNKASSPWLKAARTKLHALVAALCTPTPPDFGGRLP